MAASATCTFPRIPHPRRGIPALVLLLLVGSARPGWPQSLYTNGRWVSQFEMRDPQNQNAPTEVAIHMAALRGRADSTHVLYFTHGYSARLMLNAVDGATARHVN